MKKRFGILPLVVIMLVLCYVLTTFPFVAPIVAIPISFILGFLLDLGLYSTPSDPMILSLVKMTILFLILGLPIIFLFGKRK